MSAYEKIISHYGEQRQKLKAIEELGELIQALAKHGFQDSDENYMDHAYIMTEIADVEIMIDQLKIIFEMDTTYEKQKKMTRVMKIIDSGK